MNKHIAGLIIIALVVITYTTLTTKEDMEWNRVEQHQMHYETFSQIRTLEKKIETLEKQIEQLEQNINLFLDTWKLEEYELTAYAPLDPNAVEGMCYSGDPNITASGARVEVGVTVAADRSIPFGTPIWVDGYGWREVQDRGGAITGDRIDIAVASRGEAYDIGRRTVKVVLPR